MQIIMTTHMDVIGLGMAGLWQLADATQLQALGITATLTRYAVTIRAHRDIDLIVATYVH